MLETEIKALTEAVKLLTERLDTLAVAQPAQVTPNTEPEQTQVVEPTPEPTPTPEPAATVTKDALQEWALKMVREDKGFKVKLMSALSDHGVKTISQLSDNAAAQSVLTALGGEL